MTGPTTTAGSSAAGGPAEGAGGAGTTWDRWVPEASTGVGSTPLPGLDGSAQPSTGAAQAPTAPADGLRPEEPSAAADSAEESGTLRWPLPPPYLSPRWARWALVTLLTATAALYLWGLSRNGWANSYYSAAAQAAGESPKAWFFGSLDAANAITVDKSPASLWLMGLSVRLFGLSSWSVLVPQALLGVSCVAVLYATVRRWFGAPAGLIGGTVLALTPVATLMFRFNNPDALLVFLLVCAAWAMGRATERGSLRWIALAGGFVGLAFLAKMMQAFLVLPGFVAMYAVAAPLDWRRRLGHLAAAFAAMVASAGWWVAIVELWPAESRPYIGGSQTNSVLELMLGYNGLGRLTGDETGSVVPGAGQGSMWGQTGWTRLLDSSYGGQIAWLLPAGLVMIVVLLVTSRRGARTDLVRAATIGWGGWLVVTAAVISFGQGIIHQYYTVALAPAIGALVGIGCAALWAQRGLLWARLVAAALIAGTAWWASVLLGRSAQFLPWLGSLVLVGGLVAAAAMVGSGYLPERTGRRLMLGAGCAGLLVAVAGPAAYSAETATSVSAGALPSAGPSVSGTRGGPGGLSGAMRGGGPGPGGGMGGPDGRGGMPPGGSSSGVLPAPPGQGGTGTLPAVPGQGGGTSGDPGQFQGLTDRNGANPGSGGGSAGSLLGASTPGQALTAALLTDAGDYTWVAATVGANWAAGYQLATQRPVMAIGGFNGRDPAPTLAQFQELVAAGRIHYFISGGQGGMGGQLGGPQVATEIATWIAETYQPTTIDGITLYDLTGASLAGMSSTSASASA